MVEQINPTVFGKLFEPVKKIFEDKHINCPEDKLSRKLFLYEFVKIIIFCFVNGCETLGRLTKELKVSPTAKALSLLEVGKVTLHDAFMRFPSSVFMFIFITLATTLPFLSIPEINELGKVLLIDGSYFKVPKDVLWAQFSSQTQAVQLHLCFSLNKMIPAKFIVANGKSCQKKALLEMVEKGVTYIGDRNYASFKHLNKVIKKEAFFIIRTKVDLSYKQIEDLIIDVPDKLKKVYPGISDTKIILRNACKELKNTQLRLVTFTIRNSRYFLLTNRFDLSTFYVILLYAYRWQIELFFRLAKRVKKGIHFLNQSINGVEIHFYALFITILLELYLKEESLRIMQTKIKNIPTKDKDIFKEIEENQIHSPAEFFEITGKRLAKFKINIYWLITLKNLLLNPYDDYAIAQLTAS